MKHLPINAASRLTHFFQLAVEQHDLKRKQVQNYADLLGVTANHLIATVRETTGLTPMQVIHNRLLLEAKRLLAHTTSDITEIAAALAFHNPSQFGRWFKHQAGHAPGQFRQQITFP